LLLSGQKNAGAANSYLQNYALARSGDQLTSLFLFSLMNRALFIGANEIPTFSETNLITQGVPTHIKQQGHL
jgi:hypothetical protein